ncbi:MAG: sprT domain-containing protein [Alcanivorax sp.]|uniref:SprT-like domain-containing protein n=1 Tax=Alcanivorax sp. TaxID=1872427 RepID=UPI000C94590D|nr:SprT-like domain-containing protein [Alcanivorax sp.]MAC16666.1 sprT domain-containing protein [Alcanivorax sp.]
MKTPTDEMYGTIARLFDRFNQELFGGQLPIPMLTLQRKTQTMGYFHHDRFVGHDSTADELALNPEYFGLGDQETLQTLVHEMCHIWQHHFGNPGRTAYHNVEWGNKMESIGLMPSSTGKPGGKRTGQKMADYMIEGGRFHQVLQALESEGTSIRWKDRYQRGQNSTVSVLPMPGAAQPGEGEGEGSTASESEIGGPKPSSKNKVKYRCGDCNLNVWGKPGLNLLCGDCGNKFEVGEGA